MEKLQSKLLRIPTRFKKPFKNKPTKPPISFFKSHPILLFTLTFQALAVLFTGTLSILFPLYQTYYPKLYPYIREKLSPPLFGHFRETDGSVPHERYLKYPILVYGLHILPIYIWAIGAIFQIRFGLNYINSETKTKAKSQLKWHRVFGYVWMICSLSIGLSALGIVYVDVAFGFPLAHHTVFTLKLLTIVLTSWFLYTLIKAYTSIKSHRIREHQTWILRHVFAGMSVGLDRWLVGVYSGLCENEMVPWHGCKKGIKPLDIPVYDHKVVFAASLWVAFIIAVIMGEIAIRSLGLLKKRAIKEL
ncbi:hypothetical protein BKA69DRAFT_89068 [Paraphysoderma sedebokerense]|nr:hypothetical protein BKA69DRAFT_89068 [Paraphysoderma sedebokerense]